MATVKKSDLKEGAKFELRIGTIMLTAIRAGHFTAQFVTGGIKNGLQFSTDSNNLKSFINTHKKK